MKEYGQRDVWQREREKWARRSREGDTRVGNLLLRGARNGRAATFTFYAPRNV